MLPRLFHQIGSDRHLTRAELEGATQPHGLAEAAWDVYSRHFQRFTGATLDPMCHRLAHPATRHGSLRVEPGTSVLVVGTGPSLRPNLEGIGALAGRLRIITSPRGAEVLLRHGIVPDVVLVEHQTALDAHHSARHVADCTQPVLTACPLIAADWRTPGALLAGVAASATFVPSPLPTWGLWPATAAAMAIEAGASRVGLVGVDLGTSAEPDPAHAPLAALLGLIARLAPVVALDCGRGGAAKRGWLAASVDDLPGVRQRGPCSTMLSLAPGVDERIDEARAGLGELEPTLERARSLLARATAARAGGARVVTLEEAVIEIIGWGDDARTRMLVQECLGASFLPRLWRIGVDLSLGNALWRPLMLATHELVAQADAMRTAVAVREAA